MNSAAENPDEYLRELPLALRDRDFRVEFVQGHGLQALCQHLVLNRPAHVLTATLAIQALRVLIQVPPPPWAMLHIAFLSPNVLQAPNRRTRSIKP